MMAHLFAIATLARPCHTEPAVNTAPVPVRLGPQGRLVVPVELRRELSLHEGSDLTIRSDGHRLILEPRAEVLRRLRGRFDSATKDGISLADEVLADRREEARREDRRG
jgi:bifunctional DNA-binding transcriptional regulator/antitoxin component of YhaV-PrlF toxin-antitoxin module